MSLRKNERGPIHNSFFCCRWKQLWRQREFASPVREGINQMERFSLRWQSWRLKVYFTRKHWDRASGSVLMYSPRP
jgi:hypothetical protein